MKKNVNRCNCCGTTIEQKDFIYIEKIWGYFSNQKDGQKHSFCVCEDCYDAWISGFKYAPESEEVTEWL